VLDRARVRDGMTLWHLITRVPEAGRPAVVNALARRAPMPPSLRARLCCHTALDAWWDALGLLDTTW